MKEYSIANPDPENVTELRFFLNDKASWLNWNGKTVMSFGTITKCLTCSERRKKTTSLLFFVSMIKKKATS